MEEIKKQDPTSKFLYIGSKTGMEARLIPEIGIPYRAINCGKFRRYHQSLLLTIVDLRTIFLNFVDFWRFLVGIFESVRIISEFKPKVIFVKGGYVGLPVGIAAFFKGIPLVIHESDSVPGITSRILARFAKSICVSFPLEYFRDWYEKKLVFSGNPVRSDIKEGNVERAIKKFNLKEDLPVILVMGGSQGAHIINSVVLESLKELLDRYQVVHLSGERDYEWLRACTQDIEKHKERYKLFSFLGPELKDIYKITSLIISRAGANALSEMTTLGKAAILIPLKTSVGDHQYKNALYFSRSGAAYLLPQEELTQERLIEEINSLLDDKEELRFLEEKSFGLAKLDAPKIIASEVLAWGRKHERKTNTTND